MGIDVFGRRRDTSQSNRGAPGIGYKLTQDGQFDVESKRICNLAAPVDKNDVVNLDTLKRAIEEGKKDFGQLQAEIADSFLNVKMEFEMKLSTYNYRLGACEEKIKRLIEKLNTEYTIVLNHE